jgi:hypothetical protein
MSSGTAWVTYIVGTLVMGFGCLFEQTPTPRNDPRLADLMIFIAALALLTAPMLHFYRTRSAKAVNAGR